MKGLKFGHLLTIGVALAAPLPSAALQVQQSGSVACNGESAIDSSALISRSSGLYNDSSSTAHVTCSLPITTQRIPPNDSFRLQDVSLQLSNRSTRTVTVQCRLAVTVSVVDASNSWQSLKLAPGERGLLTFTLLGTRFNNDIFAVSCALPGRVEVQRVRLRGDEFQFQPME